MRAFSPATPPARRPTSVGAFDPASISGLRSRLLDANTFTSPIGSKYYLKDSSTTNTHLPRQGRAWLFDGTNDYGAAPTTLSVAGSNTCTVTAMVKMTGTPASLASIFTETTAIAGFTRLGMFIDTSNRVFIVSRDTVTTDTGSSITLTGVAALAVGTWYHVAVTYDAVTDTRSIYINGVLDFTSSATPIATFTAGAPAVVSVGCYSAAASNFLPGAVRDVRVYNTAKTAGEITAIYNQSRTGSGTFDSTGLLAAYPCNEESGTTGYDISGNGRHLTLTNITQATFHAADTGVTANPNNAEGYRLSGSVYIPKRLTDSLAADGNALTVTGRAAYHGCAETPCVTSNGTSVYVDLGSAVFPATSDFEVSFWFYRGENGTTSYIINQNSSVRVFANATNQLGMWDGSAYYYTGSNTVIPNSWNHVRITRVGNVFTTFLNTSSTGTVTTATTFSTAQATRLLTTVGAFSNGRIADFRITTGGVTTYFPLQDGPGSSNTNRDVAYVKSDGTSGVISNAIVNGTVSTIWGNRVPGNVEDWCVKYGGRIAANGAFVAGMLTGENAADGSAKTLTAGKFGNPFSRLNLNPATAAELNGKNIQTAYEDLPCVTGNASDVYFSLGSLRIPTGDHTISFWYYHDQSNTTVRRLFDVRVGAVLYIVVVNNGVADQVTLFGKSASSVTLSNAVVLSQWNFVSLTQVGSTITCTVTKQDGTTTSNSIATTGEVDTSPIYFLGGYNNSGVPAVANPSAGRIANVSLTASGATTYFPLTDGSGADLAWFKSDGTKGVVTTALAGTLTNVWANKTDGSKVAATKYALRAIVTRETEFNRVASDGDDRFLIYDNALSGGDLTNVEGYVA